MKKDQNRKKIEKQLIHLLKKAQAHISFENAVKDIQPAHRGKEVEGLPYTIWQLVEHLRIAQADILDFSRNVDYKELRWPEDYWPKEKAPKDTESWEKSIHEILEDRDTFIELLKNTEDIFTPFPHGDGQNMLREALLIADHNAYHVGQIIIIRRLLKDYK